MKKGIVFNFEIKKDKPNKKKHNRKENALIVVLDVVLCIMKRENVRPQSRRKNDLLKLKSVIQCER